MKSSIFSILLAVIVCMGFSACSDDNWNSGQVAGDEGSVSLSSMSVTVDADETLVSRADVSTDNFIVEIVNKTTGAIARSYKYGSMPEIISIPVGDYTIRVKSHEVKDAEWAAPYYLGEADFSVEAAKITEIGTILCKFSSIKVTVRFTKELSQKVGDDARVRVIANERGQLDFTPAETRAGYFEAIEGSSTLVAEFLATIDGNTVHAIKTFTDVAAGQHHIITFSVKNGASTIPDDTGFIDQSGIKIDAVIDHEGVGSNTSVSDQNQSGTATRPGDEQWPGQPDPGPDQPGPDDPVTDDAITIEPNPESKDYIDFSKNNSIVDGAPYKVDIKAEKLIANLKVEIKSSNQDFLDSAGDILPLSFDLANLDDNLYDNLASIGLVGDKASSPVGTAVRDQDYVLFDITDLVPLLSAFAGEHKFVITVTDRAGNTVTKTLTFTV